MTFKLVLLFATAAAALVATVSAYTDDELSQISHQIDLCLRDVPQVTGRGSFVAQIKDTCGNKAFLQLWNGVAKEELTPTVVDCVKDYSIVTAAQVADVQSCLQDRLKRPLNQSVHYTDAQNTVIAARVEKCLNETVPIYPKGTHPRTECLRQAKQALKDGTWKESLEGQMVRCLENRNFSVSADVVAAAKQCFRKELDADV